MLLIGTYLILHIIYLMEKMFFPPKNFLLLQRMINFCNNQSTIDNSIKHHVVVFFQAAKFLEKVLILTEEGYIKSLKKVCNVQKRFFSPKKKLVKTNYILSFHQRKTIKKVVKVIDIFRKLKLISAKRFRYFLKSNFRVHTYNQPKNQLNKTQIANNRCISI